MKASTVAAKCIVSKGNLLRQVSLWKSSLPKVQPYYAVKSNPDPIILKWLKETAAVNVDCASPQEMNLALTTGFNSNQIIYANTMKSINDIKEVPALNVPLTTVDSVEAVEQIAKTPSWSPDILIRLRVDDSEAKSPFSIKFGATSTEWSKIVDAINFYKLPFAGVSFHVGSGSASPSAFRKAIGMCSQFRASTRLHLPIVDIGGGFLHNKQSFIPVASAIRHEIENWYTPTTRWIAEPGRFFSDPTQTLYVPIVFSKENETSYRYIIDDSLYGQFNSIVFDHSKPLWALLDKNHKHLHRPLTHKSAMFFGKTCDSMDFIAFQKLAPKYEVGDVLAFPNMGAYTSTTATTFNGFPLVNKVYVEEEHDITENIMTDVSHPISVKSDINLSVS
jgi:ornithine decarboxylase